MSDYVSGLIPIERHAEKAALVERLEARGLWYPLPTNSQYW
jgi:hypothetical protein